MVGLKFKQTKINIPTIIRNQTIQLSQEIDEHDSIPNSRKLMSKVIQLSSWKNGWEDDLFVAWCWFLEEGIIWNYISLEPCTKQVMSSWWLLASREAPKMYESTVGVKVEVAFNMLLWQSGMSVFFASGMPCFRTMIVKSVKFGHGIPGRLKNLMSSWCWTGMLRGGMFPKWQVAKKMLNIRPYWFPKRAFAKFEWSQFLT